MSKYILGVDAGTTSFKGAIFDEDRQCVAVEQLDYTLITPKPDYVEFTCEQYWEAFCNITKALLKSSGLNSEDIVSVAISSQGETLISLDKDNNPVGNVIVWLDNRAVKEAEALKEKFGLKAVYEYSGQADMCATWPAAKILWIKNNCPEQFAKTAKFMLLEDYLMFRLTGKIVGEPNLWASSAMLNIHDASWWKEMLDEIGVCPEKLPAIQPCGTPVGNVIEAAAKDSGLSVSTLVSTGALDQTCNTIGAGITLPGSVCETTGSCLAVSATLDKFIPYSEEMPITCQNSAVPGRYTVLLWSQSAGMVFKWFAKGFYPEFAGDLDKAFAQMNIDAAEIPAGCDGLVMLPHLSGASNPEFDLNARGVFCGATLLHDRRHFTRAIMEAIAYMLRRNTDQLLGLGASFDKLYCMGGGSKSPLWLKIKASVTGCGMIPLKVKESGCLGAALLGAVGKGIYKDIDTAAEGLIKTGAEIAPDTSVKADYDKGYASYIALYDALKPYFAR